MTCKTHYFINERIKKMTFSNDDKICTVILDNGHTVNGEGIDKDSSHDAAYAELLKLFLDGHETVEPLPKPEVKEKLPTDAPEYKRVVPKPVLNPKAINIKPGELPEVEVKEEIPPMPATDTDAQAVS